MEIRTSKGKTYGADWIGGPTGVRNEIYCEIEDERALSEIAAEFEGAELTGISRGGVETIYAGYTELARISREAGSKLTRIAMRKAGEVRR
ncbi:MAG: hypothetical protein IKK34_01765 [Clostridia bacterium]|nr:hypothetical protein [Clostridia bacterium]